MHSVVRSGEPTAHQAQSKTSEPAAHPRFPESAAAHVLAHTPERPRLAIVLGSGFSATASLLSRPVTLPFHSIPGFHSPSVPGHAGHLLLGRLGPTPVCLLAGRIHYYEGHDLETVTFPIRVLAALGIHSLLLTNAAGGIQPNLAPGDFVALTDHLNLFAPNPLRGPDGARRFVDLSAVYSPALRAHLAAAARTARIRLREGIYAAVSGPSYETPAEIRALARLGADLVGMSTVPEAIVARHCGLEVAALSCVTNLAAGLGGAISHAEVLAVGRAAAPRAARLVAAFARRLAPSTHAGPA